VQVIEKTDFELPSETVNIFAFYFSNLLERSTWKTYVLQ